MEAASSATGGRRDAILRATIRLLGQHGPAGVTHRGVAAEAGVPLAATTYYFASKEELLAEALRAMAEEEVRRLVATREALGEDIAPEAVAEGIAAVLAAQFGTGGEALAKFEVYLEGARGPALRDEARRTIGAFRALAEDLMKRWGAKRPKAAARVLVAGIDGLLLHAVVEGEGLVDAKVLSADIQTLLRSLLAG